MHPFRLILLCVALLLGASAATSGEPPRGSALRAAVLDGLRPLVERDVGRPVLFKIERMNVEGSWAFVSATPQRPGGVPIDWSRTRFAEDFAKDAMSDLVLALLVADGARWRVLEYALGPTDVPWEEWMAKYRLPRQFFLSP